MSETPESASANVPAAETQGSLWTDTPAETQAELVFETQPEAQAELRFEAQVAEAQPETEPATLVTPYVERRAEPRFETMNARALLEARFEREAEISAEAQLEVLTGRATDAHVEPPTGTELDIQSDSRSEARFETQLDPLLEIGPEDQFKIEATPPTPAGIQIAKPAEPLLETQSEIEIEPSVEPQREIQILPQTGVGVEAKLETQLETQPETQPETQLEIQPETQPETQSEIQSETQLLAPVEAQLETPVVTATVTPAAKPPATPAFSQNGRPFRVKLRGSVLVLIKLPNKRQLRAALHQLSTSGGVINLDKPLDEKIVVELIFHIERSTIRGKAQMLFPMWATQGWMQPFRFVELSDADRDALKENLESFIGNLAKGASAG